jgi:hypothetical protein
MAGWSVAPVWTISTKKARSGRDSLLTGSFLHHNKLVHWDLAEHGSTAADPANFDAIHLWLAARSSGTPTGSLCAMDASNPRPAAM